MSHPPHLPFDILTTLACVSIPIYRILLSLPRFGRRSLQFSHQSLFQSHFTIYSTDDDGIRRWYLNYPQSHILQNERAWTFHSPILPDGSRAAAIIHPDGTQAWYYKGRLHRLGAPAGILSDGTQTWWVNDKLHRIGGPAIIRADGSKEWRYDGMLHRLDGPALICPDGREEYWTYGRLTTKRSVLGNLV
jgi:hypothetical protein